MTHHVLLPVADLRVDQVLQKPIYRFIVVEHLEERYQPRQFRWLEHFAYANRKAIIFIGSGASFFFIFKL